MRGGTVGSSEDDEDITREDIPTMRLVNARYGGGVATAAHYKLNKYNEQARVLNFGDRKSGVCSGLALSSDTAKQSNKFVKFLVL
jgi:hypothetical protein